MSLTVDGIAATTFTFASVPRTLLSPSFATRLGQPLLGYDWAAFLRDSLLHSGFRLNSRFDAWTFFSYHLPLPSCPPTQRPLRIAHMLILNSPLHRTTCPELSHPTPMYVRRRATVDLIRPLPVYLTLPGILIPHLKLKLKILKLNLFTLLVVPLILYKPVYITVAHPNPPPESGPLPRREFLIPLI
ncbi:hypothetical protein DFH09DRAFT_1333090 [Mycena vulgaris]|nr:hypothetical protein DFH09DRAFT_1333090 [Mycena vulgaris]